MPHVMQQILAPTVTTEKHRNIPCPPLFFLFFLFFISSFPSQSHRLLSGDRRASLQPDVTRDVTRMGACLGWEEPASGEADEWGRWRSAGFTAPRDR
ncbi:hypothetical protein CDAR_423391 [Caerostris darwini]|uniref:Uncharacterized protein n=1 Tax=Caerostris darwini TaxID=1538125 RepID=A0AAV4TLZ1_9ARAC|nr:hypothetical protein CDAR_423391 [Caerostris darwini]